VILCFLIYVFFLSFLPSCSFQSTVIPVSHDSVSRKSAFCPQCRVILTICCLFLYLLRYKYRIFVYLLLVTHVRGLIETCRQSVILTARGFRRRRGKWAMYKNVFGRPEGERSRGRRVSKWRCYTTIFNKQSTREGWCLATGCCKEGNEPSCYMKWGKCLD
jgi:hypothetical protein